MRSPFAILLIIALIFGGGYWYREAAAVCSVPLSYDITNIDEQFGLTEEEAVVFTERAIALWEDRVGRDLFIPEEGGDLSIQFVYDERQAVTDEEKEFRTELESTEGMSTELEADYARLEAKYEALKATYERAVSSYENDLEQYNEEVASWNEKGGAPSDVYARLTETGKSLEAEERRLQGVSEDLNAIIRDMNELASRGNEVISDYNSLVKEYNDRFTESSEFTQGDYGNKVISMYQYDSEDELIIVLAHELGHALGIPHVENAESVMYYHMGEQSLQTGLTSEDLAAFTTICGTTDSVFHTLKTMARLMNEVL
jgi:hypothetical protein